MTFGSRIRASGDPNVTNYAARGPLDDGPGPRDDAPVAVRIVPAGPGAWPHVRHVLETPGDPEVCWCQVFRVPRDDWDARPVARNRADLEALVGGPHAPGLLAYLDDAPVAWCGVAPVAELVRTTTAESFLAARPAGEDLTGRWAVTCFVVRPEARGRGLLPLLLTTAVDHARAEGATSIEGYPLDPQRAEEVGPTELFAGTVRHFQDAGFTAVAPLGPIRTLVVRDL